MITDNQVLSYPFNETSGNRTNAVPGGLYSLTTTNAPGRSTFTDGRYALLLNGTNQHAQTPDAAALRHNQSFFYFGRFKATNAEGDDKTLINKGWQEETGQGDFALTVARNGLTAQMLSSYATQICGVTTPVDSIQNGVEYKYLVAHDAARKMLVLILDGIAYTTGYTGTIGDTTGVPLSIGVQALIPATDRHFGGLLSVEYRANRYPTAEEVAWLFNGTRAAESYPFPSAPANGSSYSAGYRLVNGKPSGAGKEGSGIGDQLDEVKGTETKICTEYYYRMNSCGKGLRMAIANNYSAYGEADGHPNGEAHGVYSNSVTVKAKAYILRLDGGSGPIPLPESLALAVKSGTATTSVPIAQGTLELLDLDDIEYFANQAVVVRQYGSVVSGSDQWPGNGTPVRVAYGTDADTAFDSTPGTAFGTTNDGQFHWVPAALFGRVSKYDRPVTLAVRGDSISPDLLPLLRSLSISYIFLGRAGEGILDLVRPGGDVIRTGITRLCDEILFQYGVNDVRADETLASIVANENIIFPQWLQGQCRRLNALAITPLPDFSTSVRNGLNSERAARTSSSVSTLVGREVTYTYGATHLSLIETSPGSNQWVDGTSDDARVHPANGGEVLYINGGSAEITTNITLTLGSLSLTRSGVEITNGGTDSLGSLTYGSTVDKIYTLTSIGGQPVGSIDVSGVTGLTITDEPGINIDLEPDSNDTFTVRINTDTSGSFSKNITIANNGSGNPLVFTLTGTISDQPPASGGTGYITTINIQLRTNIPSEAILGYDVKLGVEQSGKTFESDKLILGIDKPLGQIDQKELNGSKDNQTEVATYDANRIPLTYKTTSYVIGKGNNSGVSFAGQGKPKTTQIS